MIHDERTFEQKVRDFRASRPVWYTTELFPCKICGDPTPNIDKLCEGCWEVEHRLQDFMRHENGRALVKKLLAEHDPPPASTPSRCGHCVFCRHVEATRKIVHATSPEAQRSVDLYFAETYPCQYR